MSKMQDIIQQKRIEKRGVAETNFTLKRFKFARKGEEMNIHDKEQTNI